MTDPVSATPRIPKWVAAVAILLLAANLRMAVNSLGAVLPELRDAGTSGAIAGLLTSLPPFMFGIMGFTGAFIGRKLGLAKTALAALIALTIGQILRSVFTGIGWLLIGSVVALAAIALGNVIMPSLIRAYFPKSIAMMTTGYTVSLSLGQALTSFITLPVQEAIGGDYRVGLGMWAIASAISVIPWLSAFKQNPRASDGGGGVVRLTDAAKVPKAWILATFFGVQSLQAYIIFGWYPTLLSDQGIGPAAASAQVGVVSLSSTVAMLFIPTLLDRMSRPSTLAWVLATAYTAGYLGLLLDAAGATTLWSILIGIGQTFFPIALYAVNLRATTHAGVLTLSAFMQSVGYVIAGTSVFLVGTIHGSSTNWTPVIIFLLGVCVIQQITALISVSKWTFEDELAKR